jgi:protein TonB
MFEQSILIDHANGTRTGAVAVSLTAQAIAVAILLLVPLIYNDRLPDVRPWTTLVLPPAPLTPPPEPVPAARASQSARSSLSARRVFPIRTQTPVQREPLVMTLTAPALDDPGVGVPGGLGPATFPGLIAIAPPSIPVTVSRTPEKPRPVGGDVQAAKIVRKVVPVYPALAKQARVSGTVHLVGIIAKDGSIQRLELVTGPALLVQAALDAVRQWVYRPTLLNGEAVEVIAPIDVIFTLQ